MSEVERIQQTGAVGARLARINSRGELMLCEPVRFARGAAAVATIFNRASISGRVELEGKIEDHFADLLDDNQDIVATVALDARSYRALKNRWMRCKKDRPNV